MVSSILISESKWGLKRMSAKLGAGGGLLPDTGANHHVSAPARGATTDTETVGGAVGATALGAALGPGAAGDVHNGPEADAQKTIDGADPASPSSNAD
ncbi:MAG TPA: hypothetical protein VGM08_02445 [Candidatus Saccharimonadales bacterium]